MSFLARLRDLDAKATPGPWEWTDNEDGYPTELTGIGVGVLRPGIEVSPTDGRLSAHITNDDGAAGSDHPDFALIVALRNSAPRLAALVEAVGKAVQSVPPSFFDAANAPSGPDQTVAYAVDYSHLTNIRAALLALDTEPT